MNTLLYKLSSDILKSVRYLLKYPKSLYVVVETISVRYWVESVCEMPCWVESLEHYRTISPGEVWMTVFLYNPEIEMNHS